MICRICVIGLGGGGNKVVSKMAGSVHGGLSIVAINTDARALEEAKVAMKMQLSPGVTKGLGTGGDSDLGRRAVQEDIVKISALCIDANLVILVVGLGGGTGTGGAPVLLNAAKQAGAMTLCFATMPFEFEGPQRKVQAERAIPELSKMADALIVVPNERLSEFVGADGVSESFDKVNEVLSNGVSSIAKLLVQPGFINLDFSDLRKVVESGGGMCTFGYGCGRGEKKAEQAIAELMESSLVMNGAVIDTARSILVSIVGGEDLTLKNIGDVMNAISLRTPAGCNVCMGTVVDNSWRNKLSVTVVASDRWVEQEEDDDIADEPKSLDDIDVPEISVPTGIRRLGQTVRAPGSVRGNRKKMRDQQRQEKLTLKAASLDRFKGATPSMMNGEDLDVPTFIRRGIKLEK